MSEQKKEEELLEAKENEKEEKEGVNKGSQFTTVSLTLMILIVVATFAAGCWYTFYQYKRMEEINSSPK